MATPKKAAERKEYIVKVETHTHNGKAIDKGGKVDLTARQAEFLKSKGVI